jgi:hypothetical protein
LDNSSSDDDDFDMLAAVVIVDTFANHKKKPDGSVRGHRMLYRDRRQTREDVSGLLGSESNK